MPAATFPAVSRRIRNLGELAGEIDVFVLDGYGVLNVGASVVPGAPARVAALRAAGKRVLVLTNGATRPARDRLAKYREMGFDFADDDLISSRDALAAAMAGRRHMRWGFAATAGSEIGSIVPQASLLGDDPADYAAMDGFALLSTGAWNRDRQALLLAALRARPRPVLVGNPDLAAPREDGFSAEPGLFAHEIEDRTEVVPQFHGKPFEGVFHMAAARIGQGVPAHRIAMVGDTLHTDVLGGAAMGWQTVLVMNHGLMKAANPDRLHEITDIRPHFIADTT
ncbi:MAG: HAD-IIA family hydrolase [Paracoccaceae bacterium]|nr:HAD-IIA family hydrolase [Paracoccaceae bacterium]